MSIKQYNPRVFYTQPSLSELAPGDEVLTSIELEPYFEFDEREVDTRTGTLTISVRVQKTRERTVYYVLSAANFRRMMADYS